MLDKDKLTVEVLGIISQATGLGPNVLKPSATLAELGVGSLQVGK